MKFFFIFPPQNALVPDMNLSIREADSVFTPFPHKKSGPDGPARWDFTTIPKVTF